MTKPRGAPPIRRVQSPFTASMLKPLDKDSWRIMIVDDIRDAEYLKLSKLVEGRPDVELRVIGQFRDVDFLKHFPGLRFLEIDDAPELKGPFWPESPVRRSGIPGHRSPAFPQAIGTRVGRVFPPISGGGPPARSLRGLCRQPLIRGSARLGSRATGPPAALFAADYLDGKMPSRQIT